MDKTQLLLDAIFFEHWARYFCFEEQEDGIGAVIEIPADLYRNCEKEVPHLIPLLQKIQHSPIVLNNVKNSIFSFMQSELGMADAEFGQFMHEMSLNAEFNRQLNVFYGFVQEEADNDSKTEDSMTDEEYKTYRIQRTVPSFRSWLEQFRNWAKENGYFAADA